MDEEELARLKAAFSVGEPPRKASPGMSAVLVPLVPGQRGLEVLYTRRAATLATHAGEVSFPGGRVDPGDEGPLAAALREAHEEVGIRPQDVDVVGHLDDMVTFYGRLVCAYVGCVRGDVPREPASVDEVDEVFTVPVRDLVSPTTYESRAHRDTPRRVVHYWHLPRATVWGITGELTARFLSRAYGWRPPRPPRVVHDVAAFIPE